MKLTGASTPVGRVYQSGHCDANTQHDTGVDTLTVYSPQDQTWDVHKGQSDDVAHVYSQDQSFQRLVERINGCSGQLLFAWNNDTTTGESRLRLRGARFCRVRNCPICQWRRSLMWRARFFQVLPEIQAEHPTARWLFLTLTIKNCPIAHLRPTLKDMNAAWNRLILRSEFDPITGWIRTTEVTKGADGSAHPHFHCLLMVLPSYFSGKYYVTQARWRELWQSVMRLDYPPIIDVRTVKGDSIYKAVCETLKYSVKPSDMTEDPAWFLEYTKQTYKLRFLATGGLLKKVLNTEKSETNEDLLLADGLADGEIDVAELLLKFDWNRPTRKYRRRKE